jgi:hypothetical protein
VSRKTFQKKYTAVHNRIKIAEQRIVNIINDAVTTNNVSNTYWAKAEIEVKKQLDYIKKLHSAFASNVYPIEYRRHLSKINDNTFKLKQILNTHKNKHVMQSVVRDAQKLYSDRIDTTYVKISNAFRDIQKSLSVDVDSQVAKNSIRELKKTILNKEFITLVDKNGNTRNYNIEKYTKAFTQYKLRETQSLSAIANAKEFDSDLLQVSIHNTDCPICINYEGNIYSISGKHKKYPPLVEYAPYHPYCKHSMSVYFEESEEDFSG